jgi:hypothetical protein
MKHQEEEEHGHHMGKMAGIFGPALEHYRCCTVYITKARSNRIVETVELFPHKFTLPFPSSRELATQAAADLTHALLNPQPAGPFCQVGDEQAITLRKLANIFVSAKPKNANNTLAPKMKLRIMHLRGCKPRFQLRGWQAKTEDKRPSNTSYHHN